MISKVPLKTLKSEMAKPTETLFMVSTHKSNFGFFFFLCSELSLKRESHQNYKNEVSLFFLFCLDLHVNVSAFIQGAYSQPSSPYVPPGAYPPPSWGSSSDTQPSRVSHEQFRAALQLVVNPGENTRKEARKHRWILWLPRSGDFFFSFFFF